MGTKFKKRVFSGPPSIFLMILNRMFRFELYIFEIHKDAFVYKKDEVMKHVKAPPRIIAELPDL